MKLGAKKPRLPENLVWRIVKCPCGDQYCRTYSIDHPEVSGCFYQGTGWNQATAQKIVDVLNQHWSEFS